jgi:hypothetical protein
MLFLVESIALVINVFEKLLVTKKVSHPNLKLIIQWFIILNKLICIDYIQLYFHVNRLNNLVNLIHIIILNMDWLFFVVHSSKAFVAFHILFVNNNAPMKMLCYFIKIFCSDFIVIRVFVKFFN